MAVVADYAWALVNPHGTSIPFRSHELAADTLATLPVSEGWRIRRVLIDEAYRLWKLDGGQRAEPVCRCELDDPCGGCDRG